MVISRNTVAWLLEEENPSVLYFTLLNLLDGKESDAEVVDAKKRIMAGGAVAKILSRQNADGSFITDSVTKKYGEIRAQTGYQPKYKGTIWQAIFLAQLGADKKDERIGKLCNFILDNNYFKEHRVLGIYAPGKHGPSFATPPCFVANMVWALSRLGYYGDERVRDSIRWLLKYQRFDDGDFKTPDEWPYRGRRDRCFGKHSCYIGCTQALKAMTVIPKKDRNRDVRVFIKKGIDFVLPHKVYKRSRSRKEPIRKEYELLTFPMTYYDDLIGILETLLFFGVKDKAVDEAVKFILRKRRRNGRWLLEKTVGSSSMFAKYGEKGKESKWITYRVINVLKRYNSVCATGASKRLR